MTQLQVGSSVNIILKADQRSGKITTGHVAEFLTKGDHPRGIKVRLTDGKIGRVQSLNTTSPTPSAPTSPPNYSNPANTNGPHSFTHGKGRMEQDMRYDGYDEPSEARESNLFDYVRPGKKRKSAVKPAIPDAEEEAAPQVLLEAEFPKIDSALVAAILADYPTIFEARDVLKGLA
ncbi:MAG: hypothetical protein Q9183_005605 [Haloplaca sp. 2 TL-2023]